MPLVSKERGIDGSQLFEMGRVDIERIAELLKTMPEEAGRRLVADGLAYENPRGAWERAEEYLSGNVRKKLVEARAAADVDGKFAPNVEALEKVQPADVPMDQINVKLGANWVPAQDIANFAGHLMQTDPSGFRIHYAEGPGIWTVSWGSTGLSQSSLAREVYGTARADFVDVLDAALNDHPIKLYDKDADGNSYLDKEASDAANEKVKEVREKFADWLWTDDERAKRLHRYYNDNFNNLRVTEYTGAHYANEEGKYILPGMNPGMSLRPNQVKDVWQAVANGKLLDASEVGAGKTFILGAIAMEWRRVGIAKKPAIAVPKPRIAATVVELQLLYPAAKILSLEKSFDKENRKRTTAQMATGDYDMIVLSHEQLDKMPMSPEIVNEFIGAELEEIEERIREAQAVADEEGDSRAGNRIVKRLEKIKERVEAKLKEALDATNKDDAVYFEETGIDALLVDECFTYETLVLTNRGLLQIGYIVENNVAVRVLSCNRVAQELEWKPVVRWLKKPLLGQLLRVKHEHGEIVCKPTHKIWTQNRGYIRAAQLQTGDALLLLRQGGIDQPGASEGFQILQQEMLGNCDEQGESATGCGTDLRVVRREVHETGQVHVKCKEGQIPFLRQAMLSGVSMGRSRIQGQGHSWNQEGIYRGSPARHLRANESEQPDATARNAGENASSLDRAHVFSAWRQWDADQSTNAVGVGASMAGGISYTYRRSQTVLPVLAESLQGRYCQSRIEDSCRGRWTDSSFAEMEIFGSAQRGRTIISRLVSVEVYERADSDRPPAGPGRDIAVYDLEVADNHNYFANGVSVSNCHAFKSLPVYSRRSELKGVPSTRSDRATSMYMRTRWLMRQNNSKGVVFATGTPLTNTLAEIYNMQRFLQPELLEERGISNFDDWMNLFAEASTDFEYKASGAYEPVTRLTEFVNLPELQQMFRQNMATNFVDDMPWVVRPKKIENIITSPMTEEQLAYLQTIRQRVEALKHMSPRERKESRENFLLISTDARKSALSPRLVNYRATDSGGKIEKVAEKVMEIHRARPGVSQMIFLDYGVNQNDWGYSVYDDIQNRLIEGGISIEKIANFGRMSDGARQKAAEKLNTGEYLIGIGSSGKMGTGINAQKRLAAMHHVDAPWLPAFVEQRNGRGHRQGNMNDPTKSAEEQTVEAYYYTTEGSFDVVMWQALTRKSKFIEQFMRGDMSVREMRFDDTGDEETGEIGPEMILAATSGNPYELDRVRLIKDIERLDKQARNHRQQQSRFRTQIAEGGRRRAELEREIEEYGKDTAQYEATKGQKFSATFNGKTYDDRKVAGNQLAVAAVELTPRSNVKIGQYRGFDIYIDKGKERADGVWHLDAYLQREVGLPYSFDLNLSEPEGAFNSADANLRYASSHKAKSEERLAALERDVETAKAEVDKPFRRAEELEQKRQKLREIQRSIEELYDQKPGRDVRKLASRLETLKPVMTFVQGDAYDIAEIRQRMADVAPNKASFDRWLLALQNSGIVQLHEHDDIARRGNPEAYVHDHKTGRYYSDLMMKQGWEPKAANVPPITAFIEAEAQTEGHINGYDLEEVVMLEMARSVELAQLAYGELYAEQQAQTKAVASASICERLKIDGISLEARKHAEDLVSYWTDFANDRTDFQTLAENSHVEYVRDPQNARAGIIYMNGHARRFYELILSEETEKDVSFAVLATPGHSLVEHQKLLDKYMVTYTANPDAVRAMNAIKEAISLAQADGVDGVVFFDVHLPGEYWEQASAHEGFHVWQYGAPELSDGWVERQPGYDQIRAELLARNYEDDPAAIAREWAAYAVTDDLERFGFTRDEGARFLHAYFSEIINQGGIDAMDRVGNVSPRAQLIIETKRWRHARNQSQSQQQARTEAGGPGASPGPETSEITTGRGPAGDRISLQGRSGNGRERGGRAPDGAEVGRDQLAGSTEALKPVRYYEAQGFTPINPASGLHLDSRLAEQGFSNQNTIQRRDATIEALMTALQTIDDAVKIARVTIGEIESRMLAQNVTVNAAEMAQPRQPSTHGQGIGW